jgi:hypothetical protein
MLAKDAKLVVIGASHHVGNVVELPFGDRRAVGMGR